MGGGDEEGGVVGGGDDSSSPCISSKESKRRVACSASASGGGCGDCGGVIVAVVAFVGTGAGAGAGAGAAPNHPSASNPLTAAAADERAVAVVVTDALRDRGSKSSARDDDDDSAALRDRGCGSEDDDDPDSSDSAASSSDDSAASSSDDSSRRKDANPGRSVAVYAPTFLKARCSAYASPTCLRGLRSAAVGRYERDGEPRAHAKSEGCGRIPGEPAMFGAELGGVLYPLAFAPPRLLCANNALVSMGFVGFASPGASSGRREPSPRRPSP